MLSERTISVVDAYWTTQFGCSAEELFAKPLRVLTHGPELADYRGVLALFRGKSAIVSIPPDCAEPLRALLSSIPNGCSPDTFASALRSVSTAILGPAFLGYAETVSPETHPTRALILDDTAALDFMERSCGPIDWEHGGSRIQDSCSAVFVGSQIAALAGYQVWGGTIAHISIVTHPEFRGRGFGRSAVAHVARRAITAGLVPQYRTLDSNRPSLRIADALGFVRYATSVAVRLEAVHHP